MTKEELRLLLERHIQRIEYILGKRETLNNTYSKIRLFYFIVAILGIYFSYGIIPEWIYLISLPGWVVGFLILIDRHRRIYQSKEKFEYLRDIKKEHIARMNLDWANIKYEPTEIDIKRHPFASDLDILGKHSLSHLIDTSIYKESSLRLINWFLETSSNKKEILKRNEQVKELTNLPGFWDKLRVIGRFTQFQSSSKDWSIEDMLAWLRLPKKTGFKIPVIILSTLSIVNISLAVLLLIGIGKPLYLVITFFSYLVYYKLNEQKTAGLFDASYQIDRMLTQFKAILFHIEGFKPKNGSELEKLLSVYRDDKERPSQFIKKNQGLINRASLQAFKLMGAVVNFVIPWDLYHAWRIEEFKEELEPKLSTWFDAFYELEALNSLANFAMLNPEYSWGKFEVDPEGFFDSKGLGHPLISSNARVTNDFRVQRDKDLFLITGSNMAGKSTFLRTVGINLILAYSGAPVCARSLNTDFFRVFSSINITDSLDDGLSHFYTEVKRLRFLLDELFKENEQPLFFFVDEIYRGTNNRERYAGSAAFLKEVAGKNGIGLVSSHDLELADLEDEIPQLSNWHFVESIEDGKMTFEYKLKSGPCPSTNALEIMKMEGLPT
ncbi:MAG: MutS family DNA mismatch repair protein [Balneolaceae bacterium]